MKLSRRQSALIALAFALAVIVGGAGICNWVPSWLAIMLGCPTCLDDAFAPAGGGCSGAS